MSTFNRKPWPLSTGAGTPKPEWAKNAVLRLKALMPHDGCRKIAAAFNVIYEARDDMTVGKSYVAETIKNNQLEILRLRREIKHNKPRPLPRNVEWALDLTFLPAEPRPILGIVDHGTRASLALRFLTAKSTIAVVRAICDAIELYGKPEALRTDNEPALRSWLLRASLFLLGIRHRRTAPFCPWQNGRIERFFGTFKERVLAVLEQLERPCAQGDLDTFRLWYNHVRSHQHLDGRTPAQVWARTTTKAATAGRLRYFSAWGGLLTGFYRRN